MEVTRKQEAGTDGAGRYPARDKKGGPVSYSNSYPVFLFPVFQTFMQNSSIKRFAYILTIAAALITLAIGFDTMSSPYSIAALGFIIWAISPYGLLALLIKAAKTKAAIISCIVLSVLVSAFGLMQIISAMYIHLDAQGGLIYIFTPLWQWAALVVLAVPVLIMNRVKNS